MGPRAWGLLEGKAGFVHRSCRCCESACGGGELREECSAGSANGLGGTRGPAHHGPAPTWVSGRKKALGTKRWFLHPISTPLRSGVNVACLGCCELHAFVSGHLHTVLASVR